MMNANTSWHASSYQQTSVTKAGLLTLSHKTAGVSLTNKEEQLSAMLLEDKDNQGGT
jgi:hypothetical protein